MQYKKRMFLLILLIITSGILSAAVDIRSYEDGYIYTDSMRSAIYLNKGETEVLLHSPGVGYYFTLSAEHHLLGFKLRDMPGGLEEPAVINLKTREISVLHEAVYCAGQVSFSDAGDIAFTIDNTLFVVRDGERSSYDLGTYANLAPISPDGKKVVFNDIEDQLWIMDLVDPGNKQRITDGGYGHVFPGWSPDSRYVAYNRLDGMLFVYDTKDGITHHIGRGADFRWSSETGIYAYVRVELNDQDAMVNTDIVVSDISGDIRFETKTPDIMETAPCFLKDASLLYMKDGTPYKHSMQNNLKKQNSTEPLPDKFPSSPVTYEQQIPAADTYLDVPYVHQVYDTPGPRGYSSCAPATAAMVMAYYGLLPKWPFVSGFGNRNDYGAYVHERYYYNGHYFSQSRQDCNTAGTTCYTNYGGYGYMWTGGSPNSRMNNYYGIHGLNGNQTWQTNWSTVSAEIDKEQPFSICNYLSGSGHLIVGIGRSSTASQRTVIANDPYGDRNMSSWPNYYGEVVYYDWPGYNHGHVSLNYANPSYTSMPWCIATSYTPPAPSDSLVDDRHFTSGFYIKADGNTVPMRYYRSETSGHNGHHWWTYTETSASDICYVTWTPALDQNGYYEIYAYVPANATAVSAPYKVRHAGGETVVVIDQSSVSDDWISLGKYLFSDDDVNHVYLGDSTGIASQIIAYDAMKWETADQKGFDIITDNIIYSPASAIVFTAITPLLDGNYNFIWDFGDGQSGNGQTVSHQYGDEGLYSLSLSIEASGVTVDVIKEDYILIVENINGDFALISPDSMEIIGTLRPRLIWDAVPNTSKYLVYVSETLNFSQIEPIESDSNIIRLEEDLTENKTIYWHVKAALTTNDTLESAYWRFRVNSRNSAPAPFELSAPESGSIHDIFRPVFSWEASSDEDPGDSVHYELYLGNHPDSIHCAYTGTETSWQPEENLVENGHYRWYVMAVDAYGAKTRSNEAFRTLAINTVNEPPSAPVQLAPLHNSYQTTRYPYFHWTEAQDPDPGDEITYKIYYWYEGSIVFVITTQNTYYDGRRLADQREFFWTVAAIDKGGLTAYSDTLTMYIDSQLDVAELPTEFSLSANYPNPFNPVTSIDYSVTESEMVEISLYDMSGKAIRTVVNGLHGPGFYRVQLDASDLPSGVYIYTMRAGVFYQSRKMLLLK